MKQATRKYLLKLVSDNYCQMAQFERLKSGELSWPLAEELKARLATGDRDLKVLDLGCGRARLLKNLDSSVEYLGVDNCSKLLELARIDYADRDKAKFTLGNLLNLQEIKEIGFDYVCAINLLQHVPSTKLRLEAIKQLKNKARLGAKIYLRVPNFWQDRVMKTKIMKFIILKLIGKHSMDWRDMIIDARDEQGKLLGQNYYHAFTLKELKTLAKRADLQIEQLYSDNESYHLILKK